MVRNLITLGGQHQGVMDIPGCQNGNSKFTFDEDEENAQFLLAQVLMPSSIDLKGETGGRCGWWERMVKRHVYSDFIQSKIVQAQYFKDPYRLEEYLQKSTFLADINNERPSKKISYYENLSSLSNFVMFMFSKDQQVIPKESSVQKDIIAPSIKNA